MDKLDKYILLDAARMEVSFERAKDLNSNYDSLYRGRSEEELGDVAPYLFTFPGNDEFSSWIFENGWGNSWGVVIATKISFEECWRHFRKFLLVKTEDNEELYFRFYDPRVLRIFLPTCDEKQLKEIFGPVDHFICEDEDPTYGLVFSLANNNLKIKRVSREEIFGQDVKKNMTSISR